MNGSKLKGCHTLGSRYDQNSVAVNDGKVYLYRVSASVIQEMFQYFTFDEKKKVKYIYLINPKLKGDSND